MVLFAGPNTQARKHTAGFTGWYFHFPAGAPKYQEVWLSQLPVGTQLVYATRFPAGTKVGQGLGLGHGRCLVGKK